MSVASIVILIVAAFAIGLSLLVTLWVASTNRAINDTQRRLKDVIKAEEDRWKEHRRERASDNLAAYVTSSLQWKCVVCGRTIETEVFLWGEKGYICLECSGASESIQ